MPAIFSLLTQTLLAMNKILQTSPKELIVFRLVLFTDGKFLRAHKFAL